MMRRGPGTVKAPALTGRALAADSGSMKKFQGWTLAAALLASSCGFPIGGENRQKQESSEKERASSRTLDDGGAAPAPEEPKDEGIVSSVSKAVQRAAGLET